MESDHLGRPPGRERPRARSLDHRLRRGAPRVQGPRGRLPVLPGGRGYAHLERHDDRGLLYLGHPRQQEDFGLGSNAHGTMTPSAFTHPVGSGSWTVTGLFVSPGKLRADIQEDAVTTEDLPRSAFRTGSLWSMAARLPPSNCPRVVQYPIAGPLITWRNHGLSWTNGQRVSVQLVERELFEWERLRRGRDGDTSTSFTDNEQANGRKFVYRVMTTNTLGVLHQPRHLRLALRQPLPGRRRRSGGHRHNDGRRRRRGR